MPRAQKVCVKRLDVPAGWVADITINCSGVEVNIQSSTNSNEKCSTIFGNFTTKCPDYLRGYFTWDHNRVSYSGTPQPNWRLDLTPGAAPAIYQKFEKAPDMLLQVTSMCASAETPVEPEVRVAYGAKGKIIAVLYIEGSRSQLLTLNATTGAVLARVPHVGRGDGVTLLKVSDV